MNVEEVEAALSNIAATFPSICQLIELGNLTHDGRRSHAIRLSGAPAENRHILMLTGGLHGREWGSCDILINFVLDLLKAFAESKGLRYGQMAFSADELRTILNSIDILVFPLVNPDGHNWSMTHQANSDAGMWRKNRRPAPTSVLNPTPACTGVDINRNFDFLFDFERTFSPAAEVVSSKDPCNFQVYQGPGPFSEPETQNVKSLLDSHPSVRWLVDLHSFSEDVLFSWGDDNTQTSDPTMNFRNAAFDGKRGIDTDLAYAEFRDPADLDDSKALAEKFAGSAFGVRGNSYGPFQSFDLYPTSGVIDDYAYARHIVDPTLGKVICATVEWGREFQPPFDEMKLIIADVTAGLLGVCLHAVGESSPPSPGVAHGIPAMSVFGPGNLEVEFVTPLAESGMRYLYKRFGSSTFWDIGERFADGQIIQAVGMTKSSFGPGNLELVARIGFGVVHFWRDHESPPTWHGPTFLPQFEGGGIKARGNPAIIQSSFGPGNLEVVTPMASGGLAHFWRGAPGTPWNGPIMFGGNDLVDAVSMVQSAWDNHPIEVVARIGDHIVQYSRAAPDSPWLGPTTIVFPGHGADPVSPAGNPVLVERSFSPIGDTELAQFELVTPMTDGTLAHFTRNSPAEPWPDQPTTFGHELRPFDAVTMSLRFFDLPPTLDVIARTSSEFRRFIRDQSGWHDDPNSFPPPP